MTPEEFRQAMVDIYSESPEDECYDEDVAHGAADYLLCRVLRELGYQDGVDLFERATRWYA